MPDYAFLKAPLDTFVAQKWESFESLKQQDNATWDQLLLNPELGTTPLTALLRELEMSEQEFASQFLTPWKKLTPQQLENIIPYWNWAHRFRHGQELVLQPLREINALHWTVIHIAELNLPGLVVFEHPPEFFVHQGFDESMDTISKLFQSDAHCIPVHQCRFCGNRNHDPRGKSFERSAFCHLNSCDTASPNPPDHGQDCCYRRWRLQKNALKRTLKNQRTTANAVSVFLAFCEQRFQANLLISEKPQTAQSKPDLWKFAWTDLVNKHNQKING